MVPEIDVERVKRWAATRIPFGVHEKLRVEVDVSDRALTVLECRPPWNPAHRSEWTRAPIARLRYTMKREEWSLYWVDRNSKFHLYDLIEPSKRVTDLIEEIDRDPTCIFWG